MYRVTTKAPEMETTVPNVFARKLEFLQFSTSILNTIQLKVKQLPIHWSKHDVWHEIKNLNTTASTKVNPGMRFSSAEANSAEV